MWIVENEKSAPKRLLIIASKYELNKGGWGMNWPKIRRNSMASKPLHYRALLGLPDKGSVCIPSLLKHASVAFARRRGGDWFVS